MCLRGNRKVLSKMSKDSEFNKNLNIQVNETFLLKEQICLRHTSYNTF